MVGWKERDGMEGEREEGRGEGRRKGRGKKEGEEEEMEYFTCKFYIIGVLTQREC